jgi:hypothetical protein
MACVELPARGLLHVAAALVLGQDEAVLADGPERALDLVDAELRRPVLAQPLGRAGGRGEAAMAVGQVGHDGDAVGEGWPSTSSTGTLPAGL